MTSKRKGIWPALVLFFLSPAIGELLSGSSPPAEFFNPFGLLVMAALYGSGAILVRELRVRWGKGWPTVFVLGAAYGIVEEGLMVKSFFDPNWMDLGLLGTYGRWAGVNWVWSLHLTIYHAVISIAIPILLVELLFPAQRNERWVGRRGMIGLTLLLLANVLLGFFLLTPYRPPFVPYLLAIVATVVLFLAARRLPVREGRIHPARVPRPLWFALVGFVAQFVFFFGIFWGLPEFAVPVPFTMLAAVALVALVAWGVRRMARNGAWNDEHRLALTGGVLMFFVLIAPLQELDEARVDNTTGMMLVGLATFLFLLWLWRRVRGESKNPKIIHLTSENVEGGRDMVKKGKTPSPRVIQLDTTGEKYQPILNGPPESVSMRSGLVVLSPGDDVGVHSTKEYEEVLVVLEGQGEMQITAGKPLAMGAGMAVYCPPETEHNVVNTGTVPLRYVFVVAKAKMG